MKLYEKQLKSLIKILKGYGLKESSFLFFFILLAISVLILFQTAQQNPDDQTSKQPQEQKVQGTQETNTFSVVRVIDGDTVVVQTGKEELTIRYIGIDTPETVKPNSPVECFGKEASKYNTKLVEGKNVQLEEDIKNTDSYGRLLRYVYVENDEGTFIMVNKKLVEDGYAFAKSYPPNVKYQEIFREAETHAREKEKGLWSNCSREN
ncbi:MAG: thermonuclease family protein [Candidatus Dojkabacteria bacterium]